MIHSNTDYEEKHAYIEANKRISEEDKRKAAARRKIEEMEWEKLNREVWE